MSKTKPESPETLTITTGGSDYVAMWKGEKQIFCYHGNAGEMIHAIAKAYGLPLDSLDISEIDTNEELWWHVGGTSLTGAKELRNAVLDKRADAEIKKHEQAIKDLRNRRVRATS